MTRFFTTLRFRLMLLVFLTILPALGLILYSGLELRHHAASDAQKDLLSMVFHTSISQGRVVEGVLQMLATLAELPAVQQQDGAASNVIFINILEKQKILGNISAADRHGKVYATARPQTGNPPSSAGRSHFERALQTKEFSVGEYGIGRASGKPTIHFGYPIINKGVVQGVVSTSIILDYLNILVAKTKMPPDATITVIDRDGIILARHPQPEFWVGKHLPETVIIKTVLSRKEGLTEAVGIDGVSKLFAFAPLKLGSDDLFVYAGEPIKTVYAEANHILTRNLLALGGVAVLALAMAWILGQVFLVSRIHILMNRAQQIAGGNLAVSADLSYQDGEFGQLAKSFAEMAVTLELRQMSLEKLEKQYRTLVEQLPAIIYNLALDDARTLTYVSSQVESLLGFSPAESQADPAMWKKQLHPDDRDRVLAKTDPNDFTNESIIEEFRMQARSGDWRWFRTEARPLLDSGGRPRSLQGVMIDITDRKKAERDRLQFSKLESMSILAGGIAHDFNNIFTTILGNISLAMLNRKKGEVEIGSLVQAEKACLRAQGLSGQLLTFAKGGAPIKKVTSLIKLVKESANLALAGSQSLGDFTLPDNIWSVDIDERQIYQVISNLLINADQAMPGGGIVKIEAGNVVVEEGSDLPLLEGKYVKLTITDQGVGIPNNYLDKIFDPYITTKQKGSGLGLATAYSIVKNHYGHIRVRSKLGVGSTFEVFLPAIEAETLGAPEEPVTPIIGQGRILVMDDDEEIRGVLCRLLSKLGYEVDSAHDGSQAIEKFVKAKQSGLGFDAVILDLTVPGGMGGKEAIDKLLRIDPPIKAIVSSGYSDDPIMANFNKYGFCEVIAKPYRVIELSKILQRVFSKQGNQR